MLWRSCIFRRLFSIRFFLLVAVIDSYCRTTCPNVSLIIRISWLLILSILLLEKKHFQFLQFFQMALYCWRSFVSDKRDWWAKSWTHETPTKKNFGPTKHPSEKSSDPRSTREKKSWTHKIPTSKTFGTIKYPQEKLLDPGNTHEWKFWTHKIPTTKKCEPTK